MKGFKGLNSILEFYNNSNGQDKSIIRIEILKGDREPGWFYPFYIWH